MKNDWAGRYWPLIMAITAHGAVITSEEKTRRKDMGDGVCISIQEWMVFVHIVEYREAGFNMNQLAALDHIPQGTFSKQAKLLCEYGLVEKYQAAGNKKNVMLQPTRRGMEFYNKYSSSVRSAIFERFFDALKNVSTEDLERFTQAISVLNEDMCPDTAAQYSPKMILMKKEE